MVPLTEPKTRKTNMQIMSESGVDLAYLMAIPYLLALVINKMVAMFNK